MHIRLYMHGKTRSPELHALIETYSQRLTHYARLETIVLPEVRASQGKSPDWIRGQEDQLLLKGIAPGEHLVLLDEKGLRLDSRGFADFLEKHGLYERGPLGFAIGGPFGFGPRIRERAQGSLSLSPMTFSHEMVRLFFVEQLYRAFTILRNESYHHD